MEFIDVLAECYKNKELVAQFNRLRGTNIGNNRKKLSPIEMMVDEATGYSDLGENEKEMRKFISFVYNCIWIRLPLTKIEEKP